MQGFLEATGAMTPALLVTIIALTVVAVALAALRFMDNTDRFIGQRLAETMVAVDSRPNGRAEAD